MLKDLIICLRKFIIRITHKNIIRKNNAYWYTENQNEVGPFCSICFENEGKLISLISYPSNMYKCEVCKSLVDCSNKS